MPPETNETSEEKKDESGWEPFDLPSGRKGRIMRKRRGEHLEKAFRVAGSEASNQATMSFALASVLCVIDDAPFTIEDCRQFSLGDAVALMGKVNEDSTGKAAASSPPST